jgi:hypothetical protein
MSDPKIEALKQRLQSRPEQSQQTIDAPSAVSSNLQEPSPVQIDTIDEASNQNSSKDSNQNPTSLSKTQEVSEGIVTLSKLTSQAIKFFSK